MGDRTRILFITSSGSLNGGAQVQYRYLVSGLQHSRYDPVVVTPGAGDLGDALTRAGIENWNASYPIWSRGEVLRWRHRLWRERRQARDRLVAFARDRAPHVVHGDVSVAPYVIAIASALAIPSVVHVRGPVTPRSVRRLGLRQAAAVIAIGRHFRDDLRACHVPEERISVIPDATDVGRFRPGGDAILRRENRAIAADTVLFGIVGRIEPFKRQLDFLHAAARLLATGRHAHFFVIGASNPNRPWYARRVRTFPAAHHIDGHVTATGPRSDMAQVMASLDVLVTLSGGSVMLEAMACGVPVITASARHPDALHMVRDGESGRVVPTGDMDALVNAMSALCDDADLRHRLGANGRRRAEALFGYERMADETMRVYDALLTSPRG